MAPLASRFFLVVSLALALLPAFSAAAKARYTGVLSFGDSLADTGNELARTGGGAASVPPYGETFFGRPTGRSSDGRLVLDFIVAALGMPYPKPYFAGETAADFQRGVNFAFSGSTALGPEFFKSRGLTPFVPLSLANQSAWFKKVLQLAGSVQEEAHFEVAGHDGRDRNQRLPRRLDGEAHRGGGPDLRAAHRRRHLFTSHRGDRCGSENGGGPRDDNARLPADIPGPPRGHRRRPRTGDRLSDVAQRPRQAAQPRADAHGLGPPARPPRQGHPLRGPVQPHRRHRQVASEVRVRGQAAGGVLRRERHLQLHLDRLLRRARGGGVR
ncbi:hypothetical protein ACQJBY_066453 [Aegilops geniculata]